MIWILWRYVCSEYLRWFFFCLFGFSGLTIVVDLVNRAGTFLKFSATFENVVLYTAYTTPEFAHYVLPFAALFAMLIALAGLAKRNEITAMLAGGVGRRAIVGPMAVLALVSSGAQFALAEYVVPEANANRAKVMAKIKGAKEKKDPRNKWFYADGGFLHVGVIAKTKDVLSDVLFMKPGMNGETPLRIEAAAAKWNGDDDRWELVDSRKVVVDSAGMLKLIHEEHSTLPITLTPKDFSSKNRSEELNAAELRRIIQDRERMGQDVIKERVDLYSRFAMPLAGFVMALLGAPFAFREHRRGGAAVGFLTGVIIAFGYVVVLAFTRALGSAGALPPEIAAWLPNIVFGGTGLYLATTLDSL